MPLPSEPAGTTDALAGLGAAEAADRLRRDGPNVVPGTARPPMWRAFVGQFVHLFALLLWAAAVLAAVGGMPELAVAIVVVVVINGIFSFLQLERAERAAAQLRRLLPASVTVRRDGRPLAVHVEEVVAGDVLVLAVGDRLAADAVVVGGRGCRVDESMLTGESVPRRVGDGDLLSGGTFVVAGEALAQVTATGAATRLAAIVGLSGSVHRPKSPLARELERVVRIVAAGAAAVGIGFFGLSMLVGTAGRDAFLFAVGVSVALVPEGLLPTVTLSLALGAQRMARHHALVRNLEAVETLGSTTFVCTDKTGTLTRNEMTVVSAWTPDGVATVDGTGYGPVAVVRAGMTDDVGAADALPAPLRNALRALAAAARAASEGRAAEDEDGGWGPTADPMEAAIDAFARRVDVDAGLLAAQDGSPGRRLAFDPQRRRESCLRDGAILVKGAPEAVLARCTTGATGGAAGAGEALAQFTSRGLRVLAVAARPVDPDELSAVGDDDTTAAERLERDLQLLGLLAFEDPPRPSAAPAIAACRRAGIRVAMLTGDHPATALAVAERIGLLGPDRMVLQGADLPADEAVLGALLDRDGVVISRLAPEDKLRITRALQARGHVVAMTGDGVNDGPALQEADIGVAMGRSGTDVAREAADLVLLDDDFATIVRAVESGRATYANIRRFLTYHLTDNVAELAPFAVWALSGGRFPLAIGVLQVLALDIGTDLLPALALGAEPPGGHVLDGPPTRRHLVDGSLLRRAFGVLGPTEAAMELLVFTVVLLWAGWRPGGPFPAGGDLAIASGAAFTAVVMGQLANAFACRSTRLPAWSVTGRRNVLLRWAVAAELGLLVVFLAVEPLARRLGHDLPPPAALLLAAATAPAVLFADALHKRLRRR